MRRPRYLDFVCPTCGSKHTRFVETNDDDTPLVLEVCDELHKPDGVAIGASCRTVLEQIDTKFRGYLKPIVKGNHDYNERERERLEKRQDDHWRREGKDEAIDRERALFKKMGAEGAGGVR